MLTAAAPVQQGPPNGDFVTGFEAWTILGQDAPPLTPLPQGGVVAGLRLDTTLVSGPFVVPPGAQTLNVTARSIGLGASLQVRARPEEGGPEIPLGTLEPPSVLAPGQVTLAGLVGRTVRIVLDPVPALGRSVDVAAVGPVETPLPGWTLVGGVPHVVAVGARRELDVADDPLALASSPFAPGPAATDLLVSLRGDGVLRADAGSGTVTLRAAARARDVRIPVAPGPGPVVLNLQATPGPGGMRLADLGLVVRRSILRDRAAGRAGRRVLVRGRLAPAGAGLPIALISAAGTALASGATGPGGGFRLIATVGAGGRATLTTPGDRTRLPGRWPVRLPGPRRR